ncbi:MULTISPECIES: hypothetical protein [Streptomyces]|uniref:Pentapeptide repeat-containing protein n=2 Tax=Streptomyces TaxID=1883 RepID=A0A2U9P3S6_STRAS|nr:hypothetical protein [Streptomyces actuosus]AWT43735.1 hypothetical protein DMT42_16360 [Streptomyces actuosus]MBM4821147.1 hypothetical protein [Streptomyces actuosus]
MRFEKQKFQNAKAIGSGREIAGHELVRCEFNGCDLAQFDDPGLGLVVRNVTAERTTAKRSFVDGVRFEDVVVDGLTTPSVMHLNGCVFRRVTLRGRIGPLMTTPPNFSLPAEMQEAFTEGIKAFYADADPEVDWALDISEAEFSEVDLYYVPGHLVRRDPGTQFLLHRDRISGIDLQGLSTFARIAVDRFEATPFDSIVAVAPRRADYFAEALAGYEELRQLGVAD